MPQFLMVVRFQRLPKKNNGFPVIFRMYLVSTIHGFFKSDYTNSWSRNFKPMPQDRTSAEYEYRNISKTLYNLAPAANDIIWKVSDYTDLYCS